MKTLIALLALLAATPADAQDIPAQGSTAAKPSFWERVGDTAKSAGHRIGQEITNPGSGRGDAFRPLTPGASQLVGIFPASQSAEAQLGHLAWPRVAVTFEEYGTKLDCWTARARIWTDSTRHHDERFQICRSSPVKVTNDLGQTGYAMPNDMEARLAQGAETHPPVASTGTVATEGPSPPMALFIRSIPEPLVWAQWPVIARLLRVTGFGSGVSGGGWDYRMWIAGYEPNGNRG
ncbi:hypothetical protein L2Y96_12910 [Luteibacter aegosomaticola]|uniref:hypothetical protein n=1 Tax=Luteibacter aegosomaticola TaxID=2911538 RepID=UPI001FFA6FC8|nr:hypothetical protein [Luteibacter aegosomaticola]UPG88321.1 hypothetical protein L2Y96_12910 [Luteibacter aegosomaticola]